MNRIQKGDYARALYHGELDLRIEEDITLPDYCSDIIRLLRVEVHPVIERCRAALQDTSVSVEVSGTAYFTALYTDGEGEFNSYSFSQDFSETVKREIGKVSAVSDSLYAVVLPTQTLSSPKVLSQRKLLARCEVKASLDVFSNVEYTAYDALEDIEKGGVDTQSREALMTRVVAGKSEGFSLLEEIKLPTSLPSAAKVLSCSASVTLDSPRTSSDEATLYGTVGFRVLYLSEDDEGNGGEVISFYQPVEFKNTMSIDDCSENSVCRVRGWTGNAGCEIKTDSFGENRIFSLSVPYTLSCLVMENVENSFVTDVYGVGGEASGELLTLDFLEYLGTLSDSTALRETVLLKSDYDSVDGVTGQLSLKSVGMGEDGYFADMRLDISALSKKQNTFDSSVRETLDIRIPLILPDSIEKKLIEESAFLDSVASLVFLDCQVSHSSLEVTGEIAMQTNVYKKNEVKYVSSLEFKEKSGERTGIRFYYPTDTDSLWSVGKKYGVLRRDIKEINGMESDTLPSVVRIP